MTSTNFNLCGLQNLWIDTYPSPDEADHHYGNQSRGFLMGGTTIMTTCCAPVCCQALPVKLHRGLGQRYWSVSEVTWPPKLEFRRWGSSGPSSLMTFPLPITSITITYIRDIVRERWCWPYVWCLKHVFIIARLPTTIGIYDTCTTNNVPVVHELLTHCGLM